MLINHDVLTVDEAAAILRVDRKTLYAAVARGEVPARKIGRTIRLSRAVVLAWLEGQACASQKA